MLYFEDQLLSLIATALNSPQYIEKVYTAQGFFIFDMFNSLIGFDQFAKESLKDPKLKNFVESRMTDSDLFILDKLKIKLQPVENRLHYLNYLLISFPAKTGNPLLPYLMKESSLNLDASQTFSSFIDVKGKTLLKDQYSEKFITSKSSISIYYPIQFEALRLSDEISLEQYLISLSSSDEWGSNSGGKTGAKFIKTSNQRFVFKEIEKKEFNMLLSFIKDYFKYLSLVKAANKPSLIAKIYGIYKVHSDKKPIIYMIAMENIFFGMDKSIKVYDLKGSKANRLSNKESSTLLDTDFIVNRNGEPLPIKEKYFEYFEKAVKNDTEFLAGLKVVDYSLLLLYDEKNRIMKMGIIDYLRMYDLEKVLEHLGKKLIKGSTPTITSPDEYKERFQKAMKAYFMLAPCE